MERLARLVLTWLVICCPAAAQTSLNLSEDLVRLGIASANMVPNDPVVDAGPLFFPAVLYAKNHQIGLVIANPGSYYFHTLQYSGAHVGWDSLSNVIIDLQGSDLYFSNPLVSGMVITNSTNLTLQNFTADYDPLPFTQVRVVSVIAAQRQIQFAVDGNWQNPTVLNAVFAATPNSFQGVEVHMFRDGRPIPGIARMNAVNPLGSSQFTIAPDPTGYATSAVIAQIRPGDVAFLGMRLGTGPVTVLNCTGCTFRNIASYSGTYWGFNLSRLQSSVLEHLYSIPRPGTDRLASNYVGLFMADEHQENQLRLNRMIRTMDNAFEYSTAVIGTVKSQISSRSFIVEGSLTSKLASGDAIPSGAAVAFQRLSDGAILNSAVTASGVAPPYSGQPYEVTFTFDRDLPASLVGTIIYGTSSSQSGGDIIERNANEEETDCCHAFFITGVVDSVFRGNYVRRSAMAGLETENALQPGNYNSPPANGLAISNNVMDGANFTRTPYPLEQLGSITTDATNAPALLTASPHQNMSITNNFIADAGSAAIWLGNSTGSSVSGNYLLNPNNNPAVESAVSFFGPTQLPLVVSASQNVATSSNTVDQTSGRVWVTDTLYRELAAYAPGSIARLNAYEIGTLRNPSVNFTDADGNVTAVAVQASTAHAIDVQIPASAALGGAYLTLTAGSLKYFGTLFIDSQDNIPALNGCTYELSPASSTTGASANNVAILVVTQNGCSYGLSVTDPFVSGSKTATGAGIVSVGFEVNGGPARTTTVEIAGQTATLTQAAAGTVRPVIQAIVDPWDYGTGLAPGEWVTITGTALAAGPARTWNLNGTQTLPTTLGEVNVSFNGIPAVLLYVSPSQINALVPATVTLGSVRVIVQANGVSSTPFMITATATQPAIYALPNTDGSTFFVTAALAGTATLVGNSAVDPRVFRAARPGDVLDLYMVGLGATADATKFLTDQLFAGAYSVSAAVTATVGGESASVSFAGLTSPGLYLVRVAIPQDLSQGAQTIQVSAGALKTISSLKLLLESAH